jgi:hypothetical protein
LSIDELRSTVMEVTEWPADVKAEMPLNALLPTMLSRTCIEITPVEPVAWSIAVLRLHGAATEHVVPLPVAAA